MAVDLSLKLQNPGNPYDPDDPDNYLNRDQTAENSNIVPWMLGGMFAVATLIGLFLAEESPLTDAPRTKQTTENISVHPAPAKLQSN